MTPMPARTVQLAHASDRRFVARLDIRFFICSYAAHRDLHSFPTRRSSDLPRASARRAAATSRPTTRGTARWTRSRRSEEHTSELQSHSDLVCRLLLEKKNTDLSDDSPEHVDAQKLAKEGAIATLTNQVGDR